MTGAGPSGLSQDSPDPDVRFLLANERTMLAWLRTGIALQAGGLVILNFAESIGSRQVIGLALVSLGLACHLVGWRRYHRSDRAIRQQRLPERGIAPDLIVLAVVLLSSALAAVLVVT